ncbi:MAG: hypothetical protein CMJ27_01335 [Phycisphaerae bacterium]|nr:hypothetical protein [Phycisphaerae bacterium]OUX03110.1 MAG: hypothetical protein CBD91_00775 [Phycisphaeraceae bacterium TMED231]
MVDSSDSAQLLWTARFLLTGRRDSTPKMKNGTTAIATVPSFVRCHAIRRIVFDQSSVMTETSTRRLFDFDPSGTSGPKVA